jgi:uncharacterized protein
VGTCANLNFTQRLVAVHPIVSLELKDLCVTFDSLAIPLEPMSQKYPVDHKSAMRWAICSAPLLEIKPNHSGAFWPTYSWFMDLWESADLPSVVHLDEEVAENMPIGRYFELLVRNFFEYHPDWRVVANQVVLSADGQTSGECDLLIEDCHTRTLYHLEVACKYFLGSAQSSDWSNWKGRNTADTLANKMKKLETQSNLFTTAIGQLWLRENELPQVRKMVWLKGYLFVPMATMLKPKFPRWHCDRARVGWYLPLTALQHWPEQTKQWLILPKVWWIVFPNLSHAQIEDHLMNMSELSEQLRQMMMQHKQRGWLIAQVDCEDGQAVERTRGMVVDDRWPERRES